MEMPRGFYTIRSGNLWIATNERWFIDRDFTLQAVAHDREQAMAIYRSSAYRPNAEFKAVDREGNPVSVDL